MKISAVKKKKVKKGSSGWNFSHKKNEWNFFALILHLLIYIYILSLNSTWIPVERKFQLEANSVWTQIPFERKFRLKANSIRQRHKTKNKFYASEVESSFSLLKIMLCYVLVMSSSLPLLK